MWARVAEASQQVACGLRAARRAYIVAFVAFAATLALSADAAHADTSKNDEEARVHFRLGTAYYDSGRFAQAAQEFKQAYELSKRPELLYNLFLAYRDAGEVANAAAALRQYLSDAPNVEERGKLEARLEALEKLLENQPAQPATSSEPEPAPTQQASTEPAPAAQPPAAPAEPPPARLTWLPWTLIGAGGALVVGGVVSGALAAKDQNTLEQDCPPGGTCSLSAREVEDLKSSGSTKAVVADALWIPGAVVAAVGVTFLFWQPWNKHAEAGAPLSVSCGRTGCGASFTTRF